MSDDDWSRHLQKGGEILWQGRPDGRFRLFLRDADFLIVPVFGLFLLAGLLGAASSLLQDDATTGAAVQPSEGASLALVLIGAWVLFGRSITDRIARRNLRYAVTDRRILRAHRRRGLLDRIPITPDLKLDVILGRFTTIRFNRAIRHGLPTIPTIDPFGVNIAMFQAILRGYVEPGPEFRRIRDGREVSRLLKSLGSAATEDAA